MGTKNNPSVFDCYDHAEPDEPRFALLGRDKHAASFVWLWATLRELDGEDPVKVNEARECALSMINYVDSIGKKSVGLGIATLGGCMELVRAANFAAQDAKNVPSDRDSIVRRFMAEFATPAAPEIPRTDLPPWKLDSVRKNGIALIVSAADIKAGESVEIPTSASGQEFFGWAAYIGGRRVGNLVAAKFPDGSPGSVNFENLEGERFELDPK